MNKTRSALMSQDNVLSQPVSKRLEAFNAKVVKHPLLIQSDQALMNAICHPGDATLVLVFGPTGVGKTTMRRRVEERLVELMMPEMLSDPERLPYAGVEAVSPERGYFNWKLYYRQALMAMQEVGESLADKKRRVDQEMPGVVRGNLALPLKRKLFFSKHVPMDDLRLTLENNLRHRRPKAFFIDEGHHLSSNLGGRYFMNQMENLKSLASTTDTLHVLVGTYALLNLVNLSAQLARRSIHVHFPRYRFDDPEEVLAFKRTLATFETCMPVPNKPDLVRHYEYLYEGCAGCIGTLKGWLYRALVLALEADEKTVSLKRLEQCTDVQKSLEAAVEIHEGEEMVDGSVVHRHRLRALLGMPTSESGASSPALMVNNDSKASAKPKTKRRIQRNPVRDVVGRES